MKSTWLNRAGKALAQARENREAAEMRKLEKETEKWEAKLQRERTKTAKIKATADRRAEIAKLKKEVAGLGGNGKKQAARKAGKIGRATGKAFSKGGKALFKEMQRRSKIMRERDLAEERAREKAKRSRKK
jgi:hypothetical protein